MFYSILNYIQKIKKILFFLHSTKQQKGIYSYILIYNIYLHLFFKEVLDLILRSSNKINKKNASKILKKYNIMYTSE